MKKAIIILSIVFIIAIAIFLIINHYKVNDKNNIADFNMITNSNISSNIGSNTENNMSNDINNGMSDNISNNINNNKNTKVLNLAGNSISNDISQKQGNFEKYKITKLDDQTKLALINMCLNEYKWYSAKAQDTSLNDGASELLAIIPDEILSNIGGDINNYIINYNDSRIDEIYTSIQDIDEGEEIKNTYLLTKDINLYILKLTNYNSSANNIEQVKVGILIDSLNGYFWVVPPKYFEKNNIDVKEGNSINLIKNTNLKTSEINALPDSEDITEESYCRIYYNNFLFNIKYDIASAFENLDSKYKTNGYTREEYLEFVKQRNFDNGIITNAEMTINDDGKYVFKVEDHATNIIYFTSSSPLEYAVSF